MTYTEFKEQFNLLYNNALSGAPGLDNYEVSSYLTKAQLSIVKSMYLGSTDNRELSDGSFESIEKNRRALNELVVNEKITDSISSNRGLVDNSTFFELSNDAMFIVLETAKVEDKLCEVKPTTHDEFVKSFRSPFRKPNSRKVWRMDISKENSKTTVELVSSGTIQSYQVRYIKYPDPIIVSDLETDSEVGGLGLTIDGKTAPATSVLNSSVHPNIVEKAVNLAVRDYRDGSLQAKIQVK